MFLENYVSFSFGNGNFNINHGSSGIYQFQLTEKKQWTHLSSCEMWFSGVAPSVVFFFFYFLLLFLNLSDWLENLEERAPRAVAVYFCQMFLAVIYLALPINDYSWYCWNTIVRYYAWHSMLKNKLLEQYTGFGITLEFSVCCCCFFRIRASLRFSFWSEGKALCLSATWRGRIVFNVDRDEGVEEENKIRKECAKTPGWTRAHPDLWIPPAVCAVNLRSRLAADGS